MYVYLCVLTWTLTPPFDINQVTEVNYDTPTWPPLQTQRIFWHPHHVTDPPLRHPTWTPPKPCFSMVNEQSYRATLNTYVCSCTRKYICICIHIHISTLVLGNPSIKSKVTDLTQPIPTCHHLRVLKPGAGGRGGALQSDAYLAYACCVRYRNLES